jgi:hypothetical protein
VPFIVLLKALEKAEGGTEIFKSIVGMVLETCKQLMQFNEEFRKNTVAQVLEFAKNPISRTADVVPSIPVFLAQLYTLTQVPEYQQYLPEGEVLDAARIKHIFRFAFEENMRRSIKDDAEPLSKG